MIHQKLRRLVIGKVCCHNVVQLLLEQAVMEVDGSNVANQTPLILTTKWILNICSSLVLMFSKVMNIKEMYLFVPN